LRARKSASTCIACGHPFCAITSTSRGVGVPTRLKGATPIAPIIMHYHHKHQLSTVMRMISEQPAGTCQAGFSCADGLNDAPLWFGRGPGRRCGGSSHRTAGLPPVRVGNRTPFLLRCSASHWRNTERQSCAIGIKLQISPPLL